MKDKELALHFVCTYEEAKRLIEKNDSFWISDCGCREERSGCKRSRVDVCLGFKQDTTSTTTGLRKTTKNDALATLEEAQDKKLIARPYRNKDRTEVDGICFCCDCCCGYFVSSKKDEYVCDKGEYIEDTDLDSCTHCGECVDVCYFNARNMVDDRLVITRQKCYGCGLCSTVCPESVIRMWKRQ